ncbi:guanylate cyclase 32E [Lingula anatina]|uniref:Guanylate cyclase n=1 Tax=Lingula anatina TaxID=7574 RepID=A0A1S3HFZ8_LINAN|nr:guanylate cyclase 32E [Lingula anatina]|eukprot:XP_013384406.1 guanylate cyclase 32E [Lingula anatina]
MKEKTLNNGVPFHLLLLLSIACVVLGEDAPSPINASSLGNTPSSRTELGFSSGSSPSYTIQPNHLLVGYLTNDQGKKGDKWKINRQARIISGAFSYAIKTINEDPSLLNGLQLDFLWNDNEGDSLIGTARLTEQWRKGAVAFFGPEDECETEAKVAAAWNLPMIAYKCAEPLVSDKELYPTFARTFPPSTQVAKSVISLMKYNKWKKFSLVYGSSTKYKSIAITVENLAKMHNMTINSKLSYTEPHFGYTESEKKAFQEIVSESFEGTRIYVLFGTHHALISLMENLDKLGVLASGNYSLVYVDHDSYTSVQNDPIMFFKRITDKPDSRLLLKAARSLLVIVSTSYPDNQRYKDFHDQVNKYNALPPFKFPVFRGHPDFPEKKRISVYAAYLYDAVMLYADALQKVVQAGENITDGKAIISKILGRTYMSIQGFLCKIDKNGDAEGNYTVLARRPFHSKRANYSMLPVGHFIIEEKEQLPQFQLFSGQQIDWINGGPPLDEPPCGYRGEKCQKPKDFTMEITFGVIGGLLLVTGVIALFLYRQRRYEQEIAGLLWRINVDEIKGISNVLLTEDQSGSKVTIISTPGSMDSRLSSNFHTFTATGTYNGQVVALKQMCKKGLEINRDMKKEMKVMKEFRHDNICPFVGACVGHNFFIIVTEYCAKGSLQDILENEDMKLDAMFIASLVFDLIKGIMFLHESSVYYHGNLKSTNCVVNSRWTLKITDFGFLDIRNKLLEQENEIVKYRNLLWKAPELLRSPSIRGSQEGDVYSFGIILHEIITRDGPWGDTELTAREIIEKVQDSSEAEPFRPKTSGLQCQDYIVQCMADCWNENPFLRPDFKEIRFRLRGMKTGMKSNIFDNMMAMMEKYQSDLESLVDERTLQLIEEKKKTVALLHRMLPKSVADQLMRGEPVIPETFSCVTIYFSDICGFTQLSANSTPMQVVNLLNDLYTLFDSIIRHYDVYKVETIGDAYMVVSGLPIRNGDSHVGEIASMSLHLLSTLKTFQIRHMPGETIRLRIGMHSGPCVAGVVGLTMPRYCLFGDTVNTASRMESHGEPLKIHCSQESRDLLLSLGGYEVEPRGKIHLKGKGDLSTYWLTSENRSVRQRRLNLPVLENPLQVKKGLKHQKTCTNDPWSPRPPNGLHGELSNSGRLYSIFRDDCFQQPSTVSHSSPEFTSPATLSRRSYSTRSPRFKSRELFKQCATIPTMLGSLVNDTENIDASETDRLLPMKMLPTIEGSPGSEDQSLGQMDDNGNTKGSVGNGGPPQSSEVAVISNSSVNIECDDSAESKL